MTDGRLNQILATEVMGWKQSLYIDDDDRDHYSEPTGMDGIKGPMYKETFLMNDWAPLEKVEQAKLVIQHVVKNIKEGYSYRYLPEHPRSHNVEIKIKKGRRVVRSIRTEEKTEAKALAVAAYFAHEYLTAKASKDGSMKIKAHSI